MHLNYAFDLHFSKTHLTYACELRIWIANLFITFLPGKFCMIFLVCQAVDIYFFTCKTSHLNASHVKTCFKLIYGIKPFQFRWIQIGVLLIGLNQTPSWKGWDNLLLTRMGYSVPTTIFIQQKKTQGGSIQSHVSMMRTADNLAVSLFSNFKTNQEKIRKTGFLLSVFKSPNSLSSALIFSADVLKRLTELCRQCIRRTLHHSSHVDMLPLPKLLKDHLLDED